MVEASGLLAGFLLRLVTLETAGCFLELDRRRSQKKEISVAPHERLKSESVEPFEKINTFLKK